KAKVLGTNPEDIDKAEDRHKFSQILDSIGVDQPAWKELRSIDEAKAFANEVSYPVLVRPSYVLSGAAMTVIRSEDELEEKLTAASNVSPDHPVVITKFIEGAQEIDVDAVAGNGKLLVHAVSEHIENAGVHSGDASLVLPPSSLSEKTVDRVKEIAQKVAKAWNITGPFNMQVISAENPNGGESLLKVIECNLRASRSFPFVSKVLGTNFIDVATRALLDRDVPEPVDLMKEQRDYLAVKVPQFAWTRLAGADPYLGVEMSSTGEMACFGKDLVEAYWTAMQSTMNFRLPQPGEGLLFGGDTQTTDLARIVDFLNPLGYRLYAANDEVKQHLESQSKDGSVKVEVIEFPKEDKRALREVFEKYDIRGVFNLAKRRASSLVDEDYVMRRNAVDFGVPLFMEPRTAVLFAQCMSEKLPKKEGVPDEVRDLVQDRKVYDLATFEDAERISDRVFIGKRNDSTLVVKIARFAHELHYLRPELRAYEAFQAHGFKSMPEIYGYVFEEHPDRVIGFVMEHIEGPHAGPEDLSDCSNVLTVVHQCGYLLGDLNRHNWIRTDAGMKVFDFEAAIPRSESRTSADDELQALSFHLSDDSGIGRR
ncbi:hypothetical protein D0864_15769, partial [Hortaea werneckii]